MEMIGYLASLAAVALGIFLGALLGYITKEELKPGRKYLSIMQFAILGIMVFCSIYLWLPPYIPVMLFFLFLVWLDNKKVTKEPKERIYYVIYAAFAFLFFEASKSCSFIALDSLIFLFGLPTGSFLLMNKGKWLKHSSSLSAMFAAISIALFILLRTLTLP